jgi:hypothetical protein
MVWHSLHVARKTVKQKTHFETVLWQLLARLVLLFRRRLRALDTSLVPAHVQDY